VELLKEAWQKFEEMIFHLEDKIAASKWGCLIWPVIVLVWLWGSVFFPSLALSILVQVIDGLDPSHQVYYAAQSLLRIPTCCCSILVFIVPLFLYIFWRRRRKSHG